MAQNVATDTMKANAKLANDVGYEATVTRIYDRVGVHTQKGGKYRKECKWCLDRCGVDVPYPDAIANDMFRRHPGCGCKISYTVNGRTQVQADWQSNAWVDEADVREIEDTPFKTGRSVGAMAKRFYVKGDKPIKDTELYIAEGTYVEGVKVILSGSQIRDVQRLITEYPLENGSLTKIKDWHKVRGRAIITDGEGHYETREIHWYQAKNIGKVEFKFPSNPKQR